jgi:hypothetical protein
MTSQSADCVVRSLYYVRNDCDCETALRFHCERISTRQNRHESNGVKIFENVTPTVRAFRRRFRYLIIRQAQIWLPKARYKSTPIATKSGAIHSLLLSERVSGISLDMCSLSARIGTYLKETAYWLRFRKGRLKANRLSRGSTQLITGSRRAMCAPFSAIAQFAFRTTAGGLYLKSVKAGFIFGAWLLAWTTLASAEDRRPDKSRLVT